MGIRVKELSFSYCREQPVLKNVDFAAETGASLAILGASGCGKSTLLKLIAGLLAKPESGILNGYINVADIDILTNEAAFAELKRLGKIGYLSQTPMLFDHLTVEQNIELPSMVIGKHNQSKISSLLEMVGLTGHERKFPFELSGGMRTRTALARLFSTEPKYLFLDEPFSSLDIARRASLYEQYKYLSSQFSTTTILVTHDIFEAIVISRELSVMNLGGANTSYTIKNWHSSLTYSEAVQTNFEIFSEISEIISTNA